MDARSAGLLIRFRLIIVVLLALVFGLLFGFMSGYGDVKIPLMFVGVSGAVFLWFFVKDAYWPICVASLFFGGNFNFLPAGFTAFEILLIFGALRFLMNDVIFGGKRISLGPRTSFLLIMGFFLVLAFHMVHHRFGMRVLGSSIWGGRGYIGVLFGLICYCIIQSMSVNWKVWKWLPWLVMGPVMFDLVTRGITYYFPSTIPTIYPFYSAVSISALDEMDKTERLGAAANFGINLVLLVVTTTFLTDLWRPSRWPALAGLILGLGMVVIGGYRSAVLNVAIMLSGASLRDFRFLSWIPMLGLVLALFGLSFLHSGEYINLPKQAQRAIVFLPGKWDPAMVDDAKGSDEFRFRTWTEWYEDYFSKKPFFGRGFGFQQREWQYLKDQTFYGYRGEVTQRMLLIVQEVHNGFISAVDCTGIVGAFFLVVWCAWLVGKILWLLLFDDARSQNPGLRWITIYLLMWTVSYFIGSLKLASFLPQQIVLAGLFLRLLRQHREDRAAEREKAQEKAGPNTNIGRLARPELQRA